jgi:hypothetical protein
LKEPTFEGLSPRQFELLEIMWSMEELEELESWKSRLSPRDQRAVDHLIRMVLLETFDAEFAKETEHPEAHAVIQRIMKESRNAT